MTKSELYLEYAKCFTDIAYYGEKYCTAFDQTQKGMVPLKVFPKQKELLMHYMENKLSIVLKPRQAGVSTVTALFVAHKILFSTKDSPVKVLIIANKLATANEFIKKIKGYIESRPEWLNVSYGDTKNKSEIAIVDENGEFIGGAKATATSIDAMRGYTPTHLIMDEAAFISNGAELWGSAGASLSTGGGAIFISTPNGLDELYYKTYKGALEGKNNFKIFEMQWWQDPRFNKDLTFEKVTRNEQTNEIETEVVLARVDPKTNKWDVPDIKRLLKDGYKATSQWFRDMCLIYNGDERLIAQELLGDFLGSGDNVFGDEYIKQQEANTRIPDKTGFFDNNLHIWEEAQENSQYILAADVSRGDSDDFSSIEIFNVDTGEQAAEWHGKVPPDRLGEMVDEIGRKYQALAVIDITGGMGQATVIKLKDLDYPWLYYSDASRNNVLKNQMSRYKRNDDQIPGFIIGPNRILAIQALEIAIRTGQIVIRSKRLIEELRTFVWINGKPDHMRGHHDDLLIAVAMLLFVFQHSFKNLKKYNAQTVAILNAWGISATTRPGFNASPIDPNGGLDDTNWFI